MKYERHQLDEFNFDYREKREEKNFIGDFLTGMLLIGVGSLAALVYFLILLP